MANKKEIAANSILNFIASALPLAILQLVVLPLINARLGSEEYGLIVTLVGVLTLVSQTFGNTLNNVRLVHDLDYKALGVNGDFNLLVILLAPVSVILAGVVGLVYVGSFTWLDLAGLTAVELLGFLNSYYCVAFLINLDYKKVLIVGVMKACGHVIGFLLFLLAGWWYFVYIVGYLAATVYIFVKGGLHREPLVKTKLFGRIAKDEAILAASGFLSTLTSYADRLLLYPLLGGVSVSIYYASTFIGKMIFLAASPVSSVLLAYLGRKTALAAGSLKTIFLTSLATGVVLYIISIGVSRPFISALYPNLVDEAMTLIWITCATSVVNSISSLINPIIIRFCSMTWQLVLNITSVVCYIIFSIILLGFFGLEGFALGICLAALITLAMRIIVIMANRDAIGNRG